MATKKQKLVAQALYEGELSEAEIIEKYGISEEQFQRWLQNNSFRSELQRLCEQQIRQMRFILARYGPVAALRLAELVGSDKPDVARRAALDMIARCLDSKGKDIPQNDNQSKTDTDISDEQAREMLLTLAEGMRKKE